MHLHRSKLGRFPPERSPCILPWSTLARAAGRRILLAYASAPPDQPEIRLLAPLALIPKGAFGWRLPGVDFACPGLTTPSARSDWLGAASG